jgi:putative uncharacterized protein (fragment)
MKKLKFAVLLVLCAVMLFPLFTVGASASSAYQTYTYSIDGKALYSPDAYSASKTVGSADLAFASFYPNASADSLKKLTKLDNPGDMVTDSEKKVYIADSGNNRIVVLSRYLELDYIISDFINDKGNPDSFTNPQGVFVVNPKDGDNGEIWVCDTDHNRLVVFDRVTFEFKRIIDQPQSQLFDSDAVYKPVAMAIDQYGRIYVVSSTTYQGIIVMDSEGEFVGFIGAQAVTISAWQILWRKLQTDEQKKVSAKLISTEYNNISITEDGFVYVTTSSIAESSVQGAINGKSKSGTYLPVKLLNPSGEEIMRRNGFWPPAGEIDYSTDSTDTYHGVSTITDVAVGPEKTWSIIDEKRQKIYTYDFNGNLLFAFGDKGSLLGSISNIEAICYQGDTLLVLDKGNDGCIVVYERTKYGDLLIQAISAQNSLDYDKAIDCWKEVLQRNSNFDAAYVGIGNAMYRSGSYKDALAMYEVAYDTENWSEAYKEVRKEWMSKWFLLVIVLIVGVIVGVIKWFQYAAKVNKRVSTDGRAKKTFGQELIYGFYVIFHPFDGFYDLKHEHRGSVRASLVFIAVAVLTFFYQGVGQGYVLNPTGKVTTIMTQLISVAVPLILFVLANWCLTTLFDGEGSFKDIFIATSYSLLPLPLLIIPTTIASNWVSSSEASIITFIGTVAFIWVGILLFFGTMVTHDYSMFKNFIIIFFTIVAMAVIVFIVLLFSMLLSKLVSLVTNLITEIQYRV